MDADARAVHEELTRDSSDEPFFVAFPKIPRFKRNYVITEKIDGTNAAVGILADGRVYAQSRKRIITPENDNYGFARWVKEHEDELRGLGEGLHFGEWWGQGIQRHYGMLEKHFSLFNTGRWGQDTPAPSCCEVVPVLHEGCGNLDYAIEWSLKHLRDFGSIAVKQYDGRRKFTFPEGIVVYHTASRGYYKILLENDDKPKGVWGPNVDPIAGPMLPH